MQEMMSFDDHLIEDYGSLEAAHARFAKIRDEQAQELERTFRQRRQGQSALQCRVAFRIHINWTPWAWSRSGELKPEYLRYWAKGLVSSLRDIKAELQAFAWRGWQGWDQSDTWNVDSYLTKLIPDLLTHLRDHSVSYSDCIDPDDVTLRFDYDDYDEETSEERELQRWNTLLNLIIGGFEAHQLAHELHYRGKQLKTAQAQFERSMALFTKYYQTLWD